MNGVAKRAHAFATASAKISVCGMLRESDVGTLVPMSHGRQHCQRCVAIRELERKRYAKMVKRAIRRKP